MSLLNNDEVGHSPVVDGFISWCKEFYISINVSETKYMITTDTEIVSHYKYLGTIIDTTLSIIIGDLGAACPAARYLSTFKTPIGLMHYSCKLSKLHLISQSSVGMACNDMLIVEKPELKGRENEGKKRGRERGEVFRIA